MRTADTDATRRLRAGLSSARMVDVDRDQKSRALSWVALYRRCAAPKALFRAELRDRLREDSLRHQFGTRP